MLFRSYSDASHRIFASPRRVKFLEMEYSIPYEACGEALGRVRRLIDDRGFKISFPVEVRFTAGDDAYLSTSTGRRSAYIAVHMFKGMDHRDYFNGVEAIMGDYAGRPHWGKMHGLDAERLAAVYPEWASFGDVRRSFDPDGMFLNAHVGSLFGDRR